MEEKRILLDIVLLLVLLFFTSFLSAAESALSSLKQIHLKSDSKEKEKTKESELLKLWLENPNELLTTLLFVKTISYSSMVFTGVYLIKRIYAENLFVGISFFVLIVLILIFSEMVPRLIARNNIYGVSRTLIIPLNTIRIVLKPLIRLFIHISRFIVGIFKIKVKDQMFEITEDEILTFLKAGTESGVFEEGEEEMITSIFEFSETTVKEILTPRRDVFALEAESKIDDVWDEILDQGFTRIPIYTETIDKIVGTVHMKDLLRYDKQTGENPLIKDFMKEAYFVPITKSLIELLEEFKLKQLHMAIVIDEYGGTQGIVTIEDLLEEIVGEIRDEFDQEEENIQQIREKIFDIKGDTPIEEVNDKLNIEIPLSEEYDTISGYIQDKLGKVADVFDQVKGDKFILKVTDMDNKRVERIRAIIIDQEEEKEE
ncbi:hemolysin family protein [Leptotrichia sp. HSP-342]|uniref:Hemolysin family protein n=1 Tax=Leptotrichia mesophila TaxID=3239303 RepID=A0AB39V9M0_9FUSO